jgi:hypothetical protein
MPKVTNEDYHSTFAVSTTGQKVLKDMMKAHHFHNSTFNSDPLKLALNEGERNVVLRILTFLDEYEEGKKS